MHFYLNTKLFYYFIPIFLYKWKNSRKFAHKNNIIYKIYVWNSRLYRKKGSISDSH